MPMPGNRCSPNLRSSQIATISSRCGRSWVRILLKTTVRRAYRQGDSRSTGRDPGNRQPRSQNAGVRGRRDRGWMARIGDRTEQGGRFARPVPDRASVQLSAAAALAAAVSSASAPFASAGSIGSASLAPMRVVPVPAVVPAVLPAEVPAAVRTSPVTGRHPPVFVPGRTPSVPVMMVVPEPAQQRAPEPCAWCSPRPPPRRRKGRTREQQQEGCYGDETSLHDYSFRR